MNCEIINLIPAIFADMRQSYKISARALSKDTTYSTTTTTATEVTTSTTSTITSSPYWAGTKGYNTLVDLSL